MSPDTKTGVLTPGSGQILHHDQRALGAPANRTRDGGLTSADEGASGSYGNDVPDFAAEALIPIAFARTVIDNAGLAAAS
jgi:hypothetical protein